MTFCPTSKVKLGFQARHSVKAEVLPYVKGRCKEMAAQEKEGGGGAGEERASSTSCHHLGPSVLPGDVAFT